MAEKGLTLKRTVQTCILLAVLFGFAFWLSMQTYFFVLSKDFGHDAGIFAYVGYAITRGKALYTEVWDNKGPLLYMIDALGILIHYRYGLYLIELTALFSSVVILYKTANLFIPRGASVACAIISMLSLVTTLEGGNVSEDYAVPFTALAFYFIAKYLRNDFHLRKIEMMLVGMCISAVFMLRLNILAFLFCAVLGVIIILLKEKRYKDLGSVFLFAGLGFLVFTAPFVLYLIRKGALKACIDSAYLGVLGSFSPMKRSERLYNVNEMVLALAPSGTLFIIVLFVFFYLLRLLNRRNNTENKQTAFNSLCTISFYGLIATLLANGLSGITSNHYFISFVPVLIIPSVFLAQYVLQYVKPERLKFRSLKKHFGSVVCCILVLMIGVSCVLQPSIQIFRNLKDPNKKSYQEQVYHYVAENSEPTDTVLVIGWAVAVSSYYGAKRMAASSYFYYANGRFSEEAKTDFANKIFEDVQKTKPKLIMFQADRLEDFVTHCVEPDEWNAFISENYVETENDIGFIVYTRV